MENAGTSRAPYVDAARLRILLPPAAALGAVQAFFAENKREAVAMPVRIHMRTPGPNTIGLYMPVSTAQYIGVKIVHLMPDRYPSVEAEVFLYDAETGRLLFWGDGKPMTGLRTAAVSAAASLRIRPQLRSLLVYGAGLQAAAHIVAFADAYPMLARIGAVTRGEESFTRLRGLLPEGLRGRVNHCADPSAELPRCDGIVTATPAPAPLFDWADVAPHAHIVAIGSATPEMNELPAEAFRNSRVWADTRAALAESGDFLAAKANGWREEALAGDLFDLLGGKENPAPPGGPTLFKSVGQAAEDLALLIRIRQGLTGNG